MKIFLSVLLALSTLALSACDSDKKDNDNTQLTDYKNRHLDKAKAVEKKMNERVDTINKQLEQSQSQEDDGDTH